MRLSVFSIGLLALLTPLVASWTKEDREIFTLQDEIRAGEGKDVTFYDLLGVSATASQDDISRAYRKRSKALHPDKVKATLKAQRATAAKRQEKGKKAPGVTVTKPPTASELRAAVKQASDRQARLSLVANVLRGPGRERYDHFLSHGFPVWKGTGYYYTRYRPGLSTVVGGVLVFGAGVVHYLALYMGWKRRKEFVERYIKFARHAAWGDSFVVPGLDGVDIPGTEGAAHTPLRHSGPLVVNSDGEEESDEGRGRLPQNRKERRAKEREVRREAGKKGSNKAARKAAAAAAVAAAAEGGSRTGPTGAKKRVVAENGKVLVVDSLGAVYLEQEDEEGNVEEFLLDPNEIPPPTFRDTALYRLPIWLYTVTTTLATAPRTGMKSLRGAAVEDSDISDAKEEAADSSDDDDSDDNQPTPDSDSTNGDGGFEVLTSGGEESKKPASSQKAKASGAQQHGGAKAKKRGKKR